jgi:CMP-N-acetylneuraminic acid synthetase
MEEYLENLSVIIPVRIDSSRIKEKIFLPFENQLSLLEWKIKQLKSISEKINIVVSSNSERVNDVAKKYNVTYHRREDFLCNGHQATFSEVITGIVKHIKTEHFAWVTVVVPLMSPIEYTKAFEKYFDIVLRRDNLYDSLVSVNLLKEYLWDEHKPLNYEANKNHTISQNLPNIYKVTNGLYMSDKVSTLNRGYFLGENPFKFEVSKIAGIDIDEFDDYEMSKELLNIYLKKNQKI